MISEKFHLPERNFPQYNSASQFVIDKKVGDGAFGKVFLARDSEGRNVALKVVDFRMIGQLDQENIQHEVEVHLILKHPNIVSLIDYFMEDKRVYLVLEYCGQGSLYQMLKNKKLIPADELQKYFK